MTYSNLPLKSEVKNFLKANFKYSNKKERLLIWSLLVLIFTCVFACLIVSAFVTNDDGDLIVGIVGAVLLFVFIMGWLSVTSIQRKIVCTKISKEANKHFASLYLLANSYFSDSIIEQKNMGTWTQFIWTGKSLVFEIKSSVSHKKPLTITVDDKSRLIDNNEKRMFCHKVSLTSKNISHRSLSIYDFTENAIDAASEIIANYILQDFKNALMVAEELMHENN